MDKQDAESNMSAIQFCVSCGNYLEWWEIRDNEGYCDECYK